MLKENNVVADRNLKRNKMKRDEMVKQKDEDEVVEEVRLLIEILKM